MEHALGTEDVNAIVVDDGAVQALRKRGKSLLAAGIVWMAWLDAPRRDLGVIYFFVVMPIASLLLPYSAVTS